MAFYKVKTEYNQSVIGWSEEWYTNASLSESVMIERVNQLLAARAATLFANQEFVGVTISAVSNASDLSSPFFRKARFFPPEPNGWPLGASKLIVPARGQIANQPFPDVGPDQVRAALHLRLGYNDGYQTTRYLAGIPDGVSVTEPSTLNLNGFPGWVTRLNNLVTIIANYWGIRARLQGGAFIQQQVLDLYQRETSPSVLGVGISSGATVSYTPGQKVTLTRFRPKKRGIISLNGTYYIAGVNSTLAEGQTIYWLRGTEEGNPSDYKILGKIQALGHGVIGIQQVYGIRVGIHKRGKPSHSPRGRRLTRVSLDP